MKVTDDYIRGYTRAYRDMIFNLKVIGKNTNKEIYFEKLIEELIKLRAAKALEVLECQ